MKKVFLLLSAIICSAIVADAQNTNIFPATGSAGIGTTAPDASAMLDIRSTTKGLLVPRMTGAQRAAIVTPAKGLLVYQTNGNIGFFYYSGTAWVALSSGVSVNTTLSNLATNTLVNAALVPDTNNLRSLGNSAKGWKDIYTTGAVFFNGVKTLSIPGDGNLFLGRHAGASNRPLV